MSSAAPRLSTRVRSVTVFRRGAWVSREGELPMLVADAPERRFIHVEGLPLTLDDASLRVELIGGAVTATDVRITLAVPEPDPSLAPPDDAELDAAELDAAEVRSELEVLRRELVALAGLEPGPRAQPKQGHAPQPSPTAARMELLAFRRGRSQALISRIVALEERLRVADELVASLRQRKASASSARNVRPHEVRKAAIIRLEGRTSESTRLRLNYFVAGARWAPSYTIRLDPTMRSAELEMRASIGQTTGEDWRDVAVMLSTANPQQWTELPELRAQRIGRAQPPPAKTGWRAPPTGADELYADYDRDLASPPRPRPPPPPPSPPSELEASGPPPHLAPPPPSAMPRMPVGAAMAPPASGSMPMPMPQTMAAPKRSRAAGMIAGALESAFGGGDMPSAPTTEEQVTTGAPAPEPGVVAGRELLEYGRLRMFGASEHLRGSLRRIDLRMVYRQLVADGEGFELAFAQIDRAAAETIRFELGAAPPRHRYVTSEGGYDYAYVAEGNLDLPSDGKFHSLAIRTASLAASPRYVVVPRESQDVFRIVALINPLAAPLLPGPVDVYVGGRFSLTSDLAQTAIGGRVELGLGVEQAIKVARNVEFEEDTSGLIKRQHALVHALRIEIANNLGHSASVEVRERLPTVPEGVEDVSVTVRDVQPKWQDFDQRPSELEGGRAWTVEVPAGGKTTLAATWVITIPNQHELVGGNRRES